MSGSIDDLECAAYKLWRIGEIGVNADMNRHARSEIIDVNFGDEQGWPSAGRPMTAALADEAKGNVAVRLSDL